MKCPNCGHSALYTVNSRPTAKSLKVWRRKKCAKCKEIFTTYESVDLAYLYVVKKSGKTVRFNRSKIYAGIYKAAVQGKNVDHGDMSVLAEKLTQEVEKELMLLKSKKITTDQILDTVLKVLKKRNLDILFRYLSYYKGITRRRILRILD